MQDASTTESLRGTVPQQRTATGDASRSEPTSPVLADLASRMVNASRGVLGFTSTARATRLQQRGVNATMWSPSLLRDLGLCPESINATPSQQSRGDAT